MTDARATFPPPTKREKAAWCAFDFANSSFVTIIVTVVYPLSFIGLARDPHRGDVAWAWAMIASLAVALVLSPLVGALADQRGRKKVYLLWSWLACIACCGLLSFLGHGALAAAWILFVLANIGFSLGESLIAAFLPELASPAEMGRLSGLGWAFGYFGGLASLAVALPLVGHGATRWVPLSTSAFFLLAGLPTFLLLRERARRKSGDARAAMRAAAGQLLETFRQRRNLPDLFRLLLCLFLEQAGVQIVITFAAVYAKNAFGLTERETIVLFIALQLAAAAGAALFGFLQDRIGGKPALAGTIVTWLAAVGCTLFADSFTVFGVGAAIAGIAMGSSQASGRAMVGTFTPPDRQGEWFGLWGIAMKGAGVVGVLAYALVRQAGSMRAAMGSTAVFFVASLVVLATVDERRGMRAAAAGS